MTKSDTSNGKKNRKWSDFSIDEKVDFLTLRKAKAERYGFDHPKFRNTLPVFRQFFDQMTQDQVEEIFSTIEPFSTPNQISNYIWKGRQAAKWAAYGRILQGGQERANIGNPPSMFRKIAQWLNS